MRTSLELGERGATPVVVQQEQFSVLVDTCRGVRLQLLPAAAELLAHTLLDYAELARTDRCAPR